MTDKKRKKESVKIIEPSHIRIGDVELNSCCELDTLLQAVVWLLNQKAVKDYLNLTEKKKQMLSAGAYS